jgi:hypothetical protein
VKKILDPLFQFSAFLFPFALVLYLVLFLLENVFPGFVSNIFDVNYFLIPVLFLGFLAAFANKNEDENEKKATRWDFMLIAGLVALSFVILLYKTTDLGWMGFFISLISSFLIALVSLIIISPSEDLDSATKKQKYIKKININYRKLSLSLVGFSLAGLFLVIIIGGLVFNLYQGKIAKGKKAQTVNALQEPTVEIPNQQLLDQTTVFVENGSGKTGKAASMAAFLRDFNLGTVTTRDADNPNYKNAYVEFNEKDLKVASYITFLLTDNYKYKIVNMLPPTNASQTGIILILGN